MSRTGRIGFDEVDRAEDPADFVRYLDATRATDFFREIKRRSYELLSLRPGDRAIDLGCGTGEDARALAQLVAPGGHVVGVDHSAAMIEEARRRAGDAGGVEFVHGDVQRLELPDASFDAVRAERLLQHVPDPAAALREMVRIARPGARIVIWEADLDLFVIDAPDYTASRVVQRVICDGFRNGAIGRELYRRFLELGLVDVRAAPIVHDLHDLALVESAFDLAGAVARAVEATSLSAQGGADWLASVRALAAAGRFSCAVGGFLVAGRRA